LLYLLSRRFEIVKQIWVLKKENNIPILQKNRLETLLRENIEVWRDLWLSKEIVEDIWNRIHDESLKIER
jgi:chorismate mutase